MTITAIFWKVICSTKPGFENGEKRYKIGSQEKGREREEKGKRKERQDKGIGRQQ